MSSAALVIDADLSSPCPRHAGWRGRRPWAVCVVVASASPDRAPSIRTAGERGKSEWQTAEMVAGATASEGRRGGAVGRGCRTPADRKNSGRVWGRPALVARSCVNELGVCRKRATMRRVGRANAVAELCHGRGAAPPCSCRLVVNGCELGVPAGVPVSLYRPCLQKTRVQVPLRQLCRYLGTQLPQQLRICRG